MGKEIHLCSLMTFLDEVTKIYRNDRKRYPTYADRRSSDKEISPFCEIRRILALFLIARHSVYPGPMQYNPNTCMLHP
jgi:hypothetical protein